MAQLFFEAGAPMGDPATFYRPDRWNPDGYYEQPDIHAINMPLINGPWGRLSYFWLPSAAAILRRSQKLAPQITATAEKYDESVIKDCRFCLTLPAWQAHGAVFEKVLICLRDPHAVALSLKRRNRIPDRLAYHLWRVHHASILHHAADLKSWYVYYPNLLDPQTFERELAAALDFLEVPLAAAARRDLWSRCVKQDLNHAQRRSVVYPQKIQDLWQDLLRRHEAQFKE